MREPCRSRYQLIASEISSTPAKKPSRLFLERQSLIQPSPLE